MIREAKKKVDLSLEEKLSLLIYISENNYNLNESNEVLLEGISSWFEKVGLKLHKGKGIIDYVKQFTGTVGSLIIAGIKGDKKEIQRLQGTIDKGEVMDFLLKLDMATLHIVTGPIHFIDAVTGWDLMANLKHVASGAENLIDEFNQAIQQVANTITKVFTGGKQKRMLSVVKQLSDNVPT